MENGCEDVQKRGTVRVNEKRRKKERRNKIYLLPITAEMSLFAVGNAIYRDADSSHLCATKALTTKNKQNTKKRKESKNAV